jgi:DNA polymerase-1
MSNHTTLYLVDGSSYLYRAYHALPHLTNSRGEPTGALLGVANMLKRLLNEENPEYIAVVFDARGPTFRHELYPEYKANRPPMPPELRQQVEQILKFTSLLGLPLLQIDGVEADDVIGTLCRAAEAESMNCIISTGDKDLAQLVSDRTTLVNTMTDKASDREGVMERFGVTPEQIVDFLALTGDKSDNIPGVEKCGPKTAAKWLKTYGTLDEVMTHSDEIGGKVGEYLRAALEQLPLARELTTIRRDLDLDIDPKQLRRKDIDQESLGEALRRYEFNSWLKELGGDGGNKETVETDYQTIVSKESLLSLLSELESSELFAFDTETTSLDSMQAELVGLSFSTQAGRAVYIPVGHDYPGAPEQLNRGEVLDLLRPVLQDPRRAKVGQHIKYDMNPALHSTPCWNPMY